MITSKELRAGNLLQSVGVVDGDCAMAIHAVFIAQLALEEEAGNTSINQRWAPIPVTGEWMEILGFEKADDSYAPGPGWWEISIYAFQLLICPGTKPKMAYICDLDNQNVLFRKFYGWEYVHQVQNFYFACTGEELSYNLKKLPDA